MDRSQILNDAETALRLALDGRQASIWTAIPGIVQSYDPDKLTCEVQPAIKGSVEDENGNIQSVELPLLVDVPVLFPNGKLCSITWPMEQGDEVLVIFASRCIDAWWQSSGVQKPMEARMHDLSDAFAIPGPRSQPRATIPSTTNGILLAAGSTVIEVSPSGGVTISTPATVQIQAPTTTITGNLVVTGSVAAASVAAPIVAAAATLTVAGIPMGTHTHPVAVPSTPFTGSTGAPV